MIAIGRRDKKIRIERPSEKLPGEWEFYAAPWAALQAVKGREAVVIKPDGATSASHKITIHYLAGISPVMRAKLGDRVFKFESVADSEERGIELTIMANEVQ